MNFWNVLQLLFGFHVKDNYLMVICIGNQTVGTNRNGNEIEKYIEIEKRCDFPIRISI